MQYNDIVQFAHDCKLAAFGDVAIFHTIPQLRKTDNPFANCNVSKVVYGANLGLYHYGSTILGRLPRTPNANNANANSNGKVFLVYDFAWSENWLVKPIITTDMRFAYYMRRNSTLWYAYIIDGRWATQSENAILNAFDNKPFKTIQKHLAHGISLDDMVFTKRPYCCHVSYYKNCGNEYVDPILGNRNIGNMIAFLKSVGIKHTFDTDIQ